MWEYYNPNPMGIKVGDCAVRATAKALGVDWDTAFAMLSAKGFVMADMSNSNAVINAVLKEHGFEREIIPNYCPDCYTVADFANDHPRGLYVLGTGTHVVTVENGKVYDTWDSSTEMPLYFWKRKED